MIKYRPLLMVALILLAVATLASISYPHTYSLAELFFQWAGVATETDNGLRFVNIAIVILLFASFIAIYFSLNTYRWYAVLIVLMIFGLPSLGITVHQKFFAEGIYQITYNAEKSNCELVNESELQCELYFLNHSNDKQTVDISFIQMFNANKLLTEELNQSGPYTIEIEAKDKNPVIITAALEETGKSKVKSLADSLSKKGNYSLHIQLSDGKNNRDL